MESLVGFIHLLCLAVWVGGLAALFVVVTPAIYRILSDDLAHTLDYHVQATWSTVAPACGVGALVSLVALRLGDEPVGWFWLRLGLVLAMLLLSLNASWALQPRPVSSGGVGDAYDPRPDAEDRVHKEERRQKLTQQLNGLVLLLGLLALWLSVGGPRI